MAVPTQHVPAKLIYGDGRTIQLGSVELFSLSRRIWVRGHDVKSVGLRQVEFGGFVFEVSSVETISESLVEITFSM